jgi:hypothetical protein
MRLLGLMALRFVLTVFQALWPLEKMKTMHGRPRQVSC